jgi:DNA-binding MarR family transcriptional regulator
MAEAATTKKALATRVWSVMFDVLIRTAPSRTKSLSRRGLTPNDSRALFSLDRHEGRPMRSLADAWECDPSNATWIVDHLETLGLAERRTVAHDRRVKPVFLTAKGHRARVALMKEFHQPPPELAALDRDDLETLSRILAKVSPNGRTASGRAPTRLKRR